MKWFLKVFLFTLLPLATIGVSKKVDAVTNFNNIVGEYSFDTELYYSKNGTSPVNDFGTEFSTFTPNLKITEKKKITYYFSFEGGKGTCKLKGNTLNTKIDNPNSGVIKEKMKIKKIKGTVYIIQKMIGKKIYWKKKSDAGKNVAWYGSNLDCSSRNLNKLKTGVTYKGTFTSKSITLYGSIDKASSMNDLWDFEKRKILVNKKRTYKISSKCRYFTLIESGKTKISSKKFYTIFTNSLGKNSSSAGIILLFKVSKGKIVDIGFSS